jgi:hypothetical protein
MKYEGGAIHHENDLKRKENPIFKNQTNNEKHPFPSK